MNISFDYRVVLMEHEVILNCKAKEYNDFNIMIFGADNSFGVGLQRRFSSVIGTQFNGGRWSPLRIDSVGPCTRAIV